MKVNIYVLPESRDDFDRFQYQQAVEAAYRQGMKVEYRPLSCTVWWPLHSQGSEMLWQYYNYRISLDSIAPGHNPTHLTARQVGCDQGWRLLAKEEIWDRREVRRDLEAFFCQEWNNCDWAGDAVNMTYRTKQPEGLFLPKPKARYFRHKDGLFPNDVRCEQFDRYCIMINEQGSAFLYVNGRLDSNAGAANLMQCLDAVSQGAFVEFDGNMVPFVHKPKVEQKPTTVMGWLLTLPPGYRHRAIRNLNAINGEDPSHHAGHALGLAFNWHDSPESGLFWMAVSEHLWHGRPLPALPDNHEIALDQWLKERGTPPMPSPQEVWHAAIKYYQSTQ